jgi:hypothetical protein
MYDAVCIAWICYSYPILRDRRAGCENLVSASAPTRPRSSSLRDPFRAVLDEMTPNIAVRRRPFKEGA